MKKVHYVQATDKVCVSFKYVRFSAVGAILPAVEDGRTTVLLPLLPYREEGRDLLPFAERDHLHDPATLIRSCSTITRAPLAECLQAVHVHRSNCRQ